MGQAFEHLLSKHWQDLGRVEFSLSLRNASWHLRFGFALWLLENFWVLVFTVLQFRNLKFILDLF